MAQPDAITCPHCGQAYAVTPLQWPQYEGRTIHCTNCGKPFTVGGSVPPVQAAAAPPMARYAQPTGGYAPPLGGGAGYDIYPPPPRGNGWAIASLVCGILIIVPLASLAAIITGIVGLVVSRKREGTGRGLSAAGLVLGVLGLVLSGVIFGSALSRARERANEARCRSNLRQISMGLVMYANDNKGHVPQRLDEVMPYVRIPEVFVCPRAAETPAPRGATSLQPNQVSYVYLGSGWRMGRVTSPSMRVVLYEPLGHHKGINVACCDGHVEFVPLPKAQQVVGDLQAGRNPPPSLFGPQR